jgi:hypothetical protein
MKKYTLTIKYNDKTDEIIEVQEEIISSNESSPIMAEPDTMELMMKANLLEMLSNFPGEVLGEG